MLPLNLNFVIICVLVIDYNLFQEKFGQGLILAAKVQCGPQEDLDSKTTAFISYIHQSFPGSAMQVSNLQNKKQYWLKYYQLFILAFWSAILISIRAHLH